VAEKKPRRGAGATNNEETVFRLACFKNMCYDAVVVVADNVIEGRLLMLSTLVARLGFCYREQ
jgi:hypothetical protein